MLFWKYCA